jgi:hypothetical protein
MNGTDRPPLYLTILRKDDTNIVAVVKVGTLISRSETEVSKAFLEELVTEVARLAAPGYGRTEGAFTQEEAALTDDRLDSGSPAYWRSALLSSPDRDGAEAFAVSGAWQSVSTAG